MARYRDFFDAVNVIMPGVARPIVEPVLRYVVEDFCQKSRIWQVAITQEQPTDNIEINFAELGKKQLESLDVKFVDVVTVLLDGEPINRERYPWERVARKGIRWALYAPSTGVITANVSVKPSPRCKELDEDLFDNWRDAIAFGVCARLQLQPSKDWSDPRMAMVNDEKYQELRNQALFEANNNRNTITSTPPNHW